MEKQSCPYPKEVMRHFLHPKNVGKIKKPSGIGKVGNILCGDVMWIFIKVKKNKAGKEIISDAKFQTFGCTIAIANSSMITEMVKGKTLEEAMKISKEDILGRLGKVPLIKVHCSVLAVDALNEAIYDYYSKSNMPISDELSKRHNEIQHTLQTIEERHKEFVELEKDVLKEKQ